MSVNIIEIFKNSLNVPLVRICLNIYIISVFLRLGLLLFFRIYRNIYIFGKSNGFNKKMDNSYHNPIDWKWFYEII